MALRLIDDASIAGNSGDNPDGDDPIIKINGTDFNAPEFQDQGYYKFSLADIVQGAQVQEATLSVFHIADETGRSPTDGVFGLDDVRWKEETASFDNSPGGSYGATDTPKLDDSTYTDGVAGRVNFDVTDYVQQKLDAGADSITFKQVQDPGTQSGNTDFASKENANGNAPQLIITGMPIPVEVAPEGLSSGVYFVRLEARERTATEQITLVR